jgi:hypothetical protein
MDQEGRAWFRRALSESELLALDAACDTGEKPGQRLLLEPPAALNVLAQQLLPNARPVRVIAFNKSETNNWTLPWRQDRVIALRERVDTPGFTNWTNKAGIWHAEPPIALLERMLFARFISIRPTLRPVASNSPSARTRAGRSPLLMPKASPAQRL